MLAARSASANCARSFLSSASSAEIRASRSISLSAICALDPRPVKPVRLKDRQAAVKQGFRRCYTRTSFLMSANAGLTAFSLRHCSRTLREIPGSLRQRTHSIGIRRRVGVGGRAVADTAYDALKNPGEAEEVVGGVIVHVRYGLAAAVAAV